MQITESRMQSIKRNRDNFRGCLLGGAIGDALGAPVEFMSAAAIKNKYGDGGITELVMGSGGKTASPTATPPAIYR